MHVPPNLAGQPPSAGYPLRGRETKKIIRKQRLCIASWNVRTLLDNDNNPQRRTAIIGHELGRYGIDIAALSETRIHGTSQLEEVSAGYTFLLTGHPVDGPTQAGVGFAIRTSLLHRIQNTAVGHSPTACRSSKIAQKLSPLETRCLEIASPLK